VLQFHRTSLLSSPVQTLTNTVNTVGVMGKGIAAEFKSRYPEMFSEYKERCDRGQFKPGSIWLWKGLDQWVLNFSTKNHWRNPSRLEYIEKGLLEFRKSYEELGIREIAFPRLGCGNGGLNWDDVRPLMVRHLADLPIAVYIHDFQKDIGKPEHDLPLMRHVQTPTSFEEFCSDVKSTVEERAGKFRALLLNSYFSVELTDNCSLKDRSECGQIVADSEDLFRVWTLLSFSEVSRADLPESVQPSALKLFSVLSELPYVRPVNIASKDGRINLAIECVRNYHPQLAIAN
jgi:O-acetyl-ADP-ribose deacetylase (regulator of RNase III)